MVVGFYTDWCKSVVLKNAKHLANTELQHLSIAPDLTHQQRKAEGEMQKEADRLNEEELTEDDVSKNLVWKVVGKKGQKRLVKVTNREIEGSQQMRGRGQRGRGMANWRGSVRGRGRGGQAESTGRKRTREEGEEILRNPPKRGAILPRRPRRDRGGRFTPATGSNSEPIRVGLETEEMDQIETEEEAENSENEEEVIMEAMPGEEEQENPGLRLGSQSQ